MDNRTIEEDLELLGEIIDELYAREMSHNCPNHSLRKYGYSELCTAGGQIFKNIKEKLR